MTSKNIVLIMLCLMLSGCNTIEKRNERLDKKPLEQINSEIELNKIWTAKDNKGLGNTKLNLEIASFEDVVVTADHKGNVIATNQQNGNVVWSVNLGVAITSGPTADGSTIYVGTDDAKIFALNSKDGKKLWTANLTSEILAAPKFNDSLVFTHTLDGSLCAFNKTNGKQMWRYNLTVPRLVLRKSSAPIVRGNQIINGFSNGNLVSVRTTDGNVKWNKKLAIPHGRTDIQRMVDISTDPVIVGDNVYAVTYNGKLVSFKAESGEKNWEKNITSHSGIGFNRKSLFIADEKGHIHSIDLKTGRTMWKQTALHGRYLTKPVMQGEYIVLGDGDGMLYWISQYEGSISGMTKVDNKPITVTPVVKDDKVFILNSKGILSAYGIKPKV